MRLVIADDEALARRRITHLLRDRADVTLVAECPSGPTTVAAVRDLEPDVLLLDVQMPGLTGFEVLAALDPGKRPIVIFSTAYDEYALAAFEVHALDYLLKPYSDNRLLEALERARQVFRTRRAGDLNERVHRLLDHVLNDPGADSLDGVPEPHLARLAVPLRDGITVIDVTTVDWIEASGDYVNVHVGGGKTAHLIRTSLATLETRLDPDRFARIHRSAIVQIDRIRHLRSDAHGDYRLTLESGVDLRVGRSYRDALLERIGLRL